MKFLLTLILVISYCPVLLAQTISIQSQEGQQDYNSNTFSAGEETITIDGSQFIVGDQTIINPLAWSVSDSNQKAAFMTNNNRISLKSYNSKGKLLLEQALEFFEPTDNTLNVYQFDSGRIILRDNVANFTFLNPKGETSYSVSNSSGSREGELESRLASDPSGTTIVLYNPVISYGSQTGSRAQLIYGDRDVKEFYRSQTEEIKQVRVGEKGSYITVVTTGSGKDRAIIYDRFGNQIYQIESDEDLVGATLDENASHLTIYSGGRVQVYQIPGGNRLGSASSRSSILFAGYDPVNQTILALGGNMKGLDVLNPEITAVSIAQRKIVREEVPFPISTIDVNRIEISKNNARYVISGLNRELFIDVRF